MSTSKVAICPPPYRIDVICVSWETNSDTFQITARHRLNVVALSREVDEDGITNELMVIDDDFDFCTLTDAICKNQAYRVVQMPDGFPEEHEWTEFWKQLEEDAEHRWKFRRELDQKKLKTAAGISPNAAAR